MLPGAGQGTTGRRSKALGARGSTVRATVDGHGVHVVGTIVAAAERGAQIDGGMISLTPHDIRGAIRQGAESNVIVFVVDTSGSMAARDRLSAVNGAVHSLLRDAYQKRDKVAVITFRADCATTVLPPTRSTDIAARRLDGVPTGGRTPLAEALVEAEELIARQRRKEPFRRALMVVLSDGRATGRGGFDRVRAVAKRFRDRELAGAVVIDCESGRVKLGLAAELARYLDAPCVTLGEVNADAVAGVVRAGL